MKKPREFWILPEQDWYEQQRWLNDPTDEITDAIRVIEYSAFAELENKFKQLEAKVCKTTHVLHTAIEELQSDYEHKQEKKK